MLRSPGPWDVENSSRALGDEGAPPVPDAMRAVRRVTRAPVARLPVMPAVALVLLALLALCLPAGLGFSVPAALAVLPRWRRAVGPAALVGLLLLAGAPLVRSPPRVGAQHGHL